MLVCPLKIMGKRFPLAILKSVRFNNSDCCNNLVFMIWNNKLLKSKLVLSYPGGLLKVINKKVIWPEQPVKIKRIATERAPSFFYDSAIYPSQQVCMYSMLIQDHTINDFCQFRNISAWHDSVFNSIDSIILGILWNNIAIIHRLIVQYIGATLPQRSCVRADNILWWIKTKLPKSTHT